MNVSTPTFQFHLVSLTCQVSPDMILLMSLSVTHLPGVPGYDLADGVMEPLDEFVDDAGIEENLVLHVNHISFQSNAVIDDVSMEGALHTTM